MSRLGGQAVYDTDFNITWLADANYAQTSGYDTDGMMFWTDANAWAASLNIGGYTGWRLPSSDTACNNFNCTNSELGHLYYTELGVTLNNDITSSTNPDLALFTNVQSVYYWSSTELAPVPYLAWIFQTGTGFQANGSKDDSHPAWAVRTGDVGGGGGTVPEPGMIWLFGAGALAWSRSRTRRRG